MQINLGIRVLVCVGVSCGVVWWREARADADGRCLVLQYHDGAAPLGAPPEGEDLYHHNHEESGGAGLAGGLMEGELLGRLPHALLCPHCGRSYTHRSTLRRHLRAHTDDKPYGCGMCGYRAIQRSDVTRHMRTHTGEKPYPCPHCQHRASQSGDLDRHIVSVHPDLCHECQICPHRAPSHASMVSHLRKKHNWNVTVSCLRNCCVILLLVIFLTYASKTTFCHVLIPVFIQILLLKNRNISPDLLTFLSDFSSQRLPVGLGSKALCSFL